MERLPERLMTPARLIFQAAVRAKVPAILVGGAAVSLNGSNRFTKMNCDLDINVASFNFLTQRSRFEPPALPKEFSVRQVSATCLNVTYMHPLEAIRCDMSTNYATALPSLMSYTRQVGHVRYAACNLLLAHKIRTYGDRWNGIKLASDLEDIVFLVGLMMDRGERMPQVLRQLILTSDVLDSFRTALPESERLLFKFLADVSIGG
ncbi:uncharacterized protein EV420DRAFT_1272440 [Desarmillaria tabescens]|uniref:Uncharacterized protein n=1 Tax=Armillaria tabescens TaxID=1929756 RepID=A0AA39N273_ARMTA|nr:uncharacterized protein EV420DRAFT_1272440 [Desarmillaria tabescens]KAK0455476.1 hypothetical protein EV420DRAFT_1272440 [Desarmillaria tabescens]